ncbi:MAG: methyltransferase [Oscillatoria sp. SIO1A7]|nr:methyltransferase [Oscillatoria sp. SIO1A7]
MSKIKNVLKSVYWGINKSFPIRYLRAAQFRRLRPLGNGKMRGTPIVRYYWYQYLHKHKADIRGRGLEIGTAKTISRFGGEALTQADVIDVSAHSSEVTIVADLSRADTVPADTHDCFVNQFTMHVIYDVEAALYHSVRLLKPGGVLLVNFSCVDYYFPDGLDMGTGTPMFLYHWFTPIGVDNLLRKIGLTDADYTLEVYGNLFARVAYQINMPAEELTKSELENKDTHYPVLICARVVKPAQWQAPQPEYLEPWHPQSKPAVWSPITGERV